MIWSTLRSEIGPELPVGVYFKQKGITLSNEEKIGSECTHTWMIDSPNGPTSVGVCKLCGVRNEFKNSMPVSGWDRAGAQGRRARQART